MGWNLRDTAPDQIAAAIQAAAPGLADWMVNIVARDVAAGKLSRSEFARKLDKARAARLRGHPNPPGYLHFCLRELYTMAGLPLPWTRRTADKPQEKRA